MDVEGWSTAEGSSFGVNIYTIYSSDVKVQNFCSENQRTMTVDDGRVDITIDSVTHVKYYFLSASNFLGRSLAPIILDITLAKIPHGISSSLGTS